MILKKILIVDDDESSLFMLNDILKKLGFINIIKACDGVECMNIYNQNNDFDIIFVDLKMPKCSGYDVIKSIRGLNKNVTIIVLSAYDSEDIKKISILSGANEYIAKPITIEKMKKLLKNII